MTAAPDRLQVLLDRACRGVASAAEAEQLRAAVSALQQQLAAFHEGEEPYEDDAVVPAPGQWIWYWNRATPERRQEIAAGVIERHDRLNHYTWTERIQLHQRAEAAEWRAGSADRYRAAWRSARRRAQAVPITRDLVAKMRNAQSPNGRALAAMWAYKLDRALNGYDHRW